MASKKHHPHPGEILLEDILPSLQLVLGLAWCAIFSNLSSCFSYFLFFPDIMMQHSERQI